jgi:hypothetical protein
MKVRDILINAAILGTGAGFVASQLPPELTMNQEELDRMHAVEQSVHYDGCNEVRTLGKAPLRRGQPGYGAHMDGDGDGVACEPYRY